MPLSRRELIAVMLGTPALLSGCGAAPPLPPAGELFGQEFEIGHRLRDGFRPQPTADAWENVDVVIVGGGAAGLAAAWKLDRAGCDDFVVLELEAVGGGTSRSGECVLTPYPWGAHYLPVPLPDNQPLIQLLQELGTVESLAADGAPIVCEQDLCREPEERLFFGGEWNEGLYPSAGATPDDLAELAAFRQEIDRWVGWRDAQGRRAFTIPTRLASDDAALSELDQFSMAEWLRQKGWKSDRLHWLVDYSCRDDYGQSSERTSAWAGLHYFAARITAPGAEHQPLITWPEGNGRLIRHLSERAGARVKLGTTVTQIRPTTRAEADIVEVVTVAKESQEVRGWRAKSVIFAAPQFLVPRLIEGFTARTGRKVDQFEYGSWFVANLFLNNRPSERHYPLCWDNVIHNSRSLGYVVATHQSGSDYGPTVWTWYYPFSEANVRVVREQLLRATWAGLAEVVLTDLEQAHPEIRSLVTRLDIFRWGHAMIHPKPGFLTSRQRREARLPDGRIHFANTDLSGIALFEEAFDHGCRAAEEVLATLTRKGA